MEPLINPTAAKIEKAILDHEAFKEGFEINAAEDGGVVTLRGSVPSKKYLQLAESIAQGIEDVAGVINQMKINTDLEEEPDLLEDETQVPSSRSGPHARG